MAIIRDLFEGRALRTKISCVVIATNIVPMVAPTLGAELLILGSWRLIYLALAACGLVWLVTIALGFAESARIDDTRRLTPSAVVRSYIRIVRHPLCRGYILVSAAAIARSLLCRRFVVVFR